MYTQGPIRGRFSGAPGLGQILLVRGEGWGGGGRERGCEGKVEDWGGIGNGYLGNALFQDLFVDVKETSSKVVPFDGASRGKKQQFLGYTEP